MAERQFTYQRGPGVTRTMIFDSDRPNEFTTRTDFDATNLADANKLAAELHDPRAVNKHLARVPLYIYEQSVREKWDDADWKKFLNDPDNAAFRVWKGRV